MSKATIDILELLHGELVKSLLSKIRTGEATAADLSVARQLLKDNGVDAIPTESNGIGKLAQELPFTDEAGDEPVH